VAADPPRGVAVRCEQATKRYRSQTYRSLRQELSSRRSPTVDQRRAAFEDVSFEVASGEAYAVIGPNGAGKSTLLRVAAGITAPTSGVVRVRGRVGALIEVGAGIHPELTGRENIWLYGAILGLKRGEIAQRFDQIVEFAELSTVLDRPVKHYSSGMQLRLGFSIAAGVEPDILVVDEALAVGDARFQVRCVERMAAMVRSGTTLIYVSHDLASVSTVCRRAMLLIDGKVAHDGAVSDTIGEYLRWMESGAGNTTVGASQSTPIAPGGAVTVVVPLPKDTRRPLTVALGIRDGHPWNLLGATTTVDHDRTVAVCRIESLPLADGVYQVWASVDGDGADGGWTLLRSIRVVDAAADPRPLWLPAVSFAHTWE
jgi:ABC-type polysaccharide/polyol phosphate transport system ATPase subunit